MNSVQVLQITAGLLESLREQESAQLHVLGRFRHVVNLTWRDTVFSLMTPDGEIGPFHLVVTSLPVLDEAPIGIWESFQHLRLGHTVLDFSTAQVWSPCPAWAQLRPAPHLWSLLLDFALTLTWPDYLLAPALALQQALETGSGAGLAEAARVLAGLGVGLTPAGDDVLAGAMLRLHLEGRGEEAATLYGAAAPLTTRLSRAFLAAARDGRVNAAWMRLLHTLHTGPAEALEQALARILVFGATSGADMLLGFTLLHSTIPLSRGGFPVKLNISGGL